MTAVTAERAERRQARASGPGESATPPAVVPGSAEAGNAGPERCRPISLSWIRNASPKRPQGARDTPIFSGEPVDPGNVDSMVKVGREVPIPIAGGERLYTRYQFRPFVESQALDILQPDIGLCGGIREMMKIAAMAEVYNLHVQPHHCGGPVATAAAVHAVFAMPNFIILEWFPYCPDGRYAIVDEAYGQKAKGGRLACPTAPGLGVELDEGYLGRFPAISAWAE